MVPVAVPVTVVVRPAGRVGVLPTTRFALADDTGRDLAVAPPRPSSGRPVNVSPAPRQFPSPWVTPGVVARPHAGPHGALAEVGGHEEVPQGPTGLSATVAAKDIAAISNRHRHRRRHPFPVPEAKLPKSETTRACATLKGGR